MSTPSKPTPTESNKMGIGPGTRKHSDGASFPESPAKSTMPAWYQELLDSVSQRVELGRARAVAAANQVLVATYWAIGGDILNRQGAEGWGAKVTSRLAADLRERFPQSKGFSPRNLMFMRALAATWNEQAIVKAPLSQLPWYHHIALILKLSDPDNRVWYAAALRSRTSGR